MKEKMSIEVLTGTSKKSGKPYDYLQITLGDIRLPFLFIQSTEKTYYQSIQGKYTVIKE